MITHEQPLQRPDSIPQISNMATVFYDGQCPLCSREIRHYRRLRGAETIQWIDITRDETSLAAHGLKHEVAMARFHVRDASGCWQTGAWGFAELWSHLPAYRWLAYTLRTLRLLPLLDRVYSVFARRRVRHPCSDESCSLSATTNETTSSGDSAISQVSSARPRQDS
jgi:predicted DCC family thiol-disulfide oxidoreductase YuxK